MSMPSAELNAILASLKESTEGPLAQRWKRLGRAIGVTPSFVE